MKDIAPVLISILLFSLPLVAMLTRHQRKMTELLNANNNNQLQAQVFELSRQVVELRQQLSQVQASLPAQVSGNNQAPLYQQDTLNS